MFQLEQQEQPKSTTGLLASMILATHRKVVKEHKTLTQDYIPGEKLHLWQTTDNWVVVILERDRKCVSIKRESGTLRSVLPGYEKQWNDYFASLAMSAH